MSHDVPRANVHAVTAKPDTWRPVRLDGALTAKYVCPDGHLGYLDDHEIGPGGDVHPSVVCPEPGCDFHDFLRLLGWEAA